MKSARAAILLIFVGSQAIACTCVTAFGDNAKTLMRSETLVFRGLVLDRKTLPVHSDMKGRNRYSIEFLVREHWKGSPGSRVLIYALDPGTDCLGDHFEPGKEYLVYARERASKDVYLDESLWYGWKDILPEGSPMLIPNTACMPGGEVGEVKAALRELGRGRHPAKPGGF